MRKLIPWAIALVVVQVPLLALVLVHARTWGGPDTDSASGVAVAPDGSVYVTGTTLSFGQGGRDAFLLKYAADGTLVWQQTYGTGPAFPADEFGNGIAVAPNGSAVYLTGQYGDGRVFLAKFGSGGGNPIWQKAYGALQASIFASGVAVSADGNNVYVAGGDFDDPSGFGQGDAILAKFNAADGSLVWDKRWGGQFNESARAVTVGADGGIYIAGDANSFVGNDAFVVKFDASGAVLWQRDYNIPGPNLTGQVAAFGVATGPDGGVYITGNAFETGTKKNIILVKFDSSGNMLWDKIGGPGFGAGLGVAVNADFVYVTGNVVVDDPTATGGNAFVARYFPNGRPKDASFFGGSDDESGEAIAVAPDGSAVAVGHAGATPYAFSHLTKTVKAPASQLTTPGGNTAVPGNPVANAAGIVAAQNGSQTFGGALDAMLIRVRP